MSMSGMVGVGVCIVVGSSRGSGGVAVPSRTVVVSSVGMSLCSVWLVSGPFIQLLPLLQRMTRASFESVPENAVFPRIPVQINHSGSQRNSERWEHVPSWIVTREPLLVSQFPLNAERVRGKGGRGKSVLMLHAVVGLCDAACCCMSEVGGMHACSP